MAVNWSLGVMPDIGGNALNAFRTGREEVRQEQRDNDMLALQRDRLAAQQAEAQRRAKADERDEVGMFAKLLDHAKDEATYQQALGAAKQYGLPVDQAPPSFDPNWVAMQRVIVKAFQKDGGQALSTAGKQAIDMGYEPGTPEFEKVVHDIFVAGESKPYVVGGETRLYQPKIGGPGQAVGSPPPEAIEELRQNPATAAQFDEIFGEGAAASVLGQGGQPTQGSPPFEEAFRDMSRPPG